METQRRRTAAAGLATALILLLVLALAARFEDDRLAARQQRQAARVVIQGASLYHQHCRTCHGNRGEGVGQLGPVLSNHHFFTARLAEVGWPDTLATYVHAAIDLGRLTASRPIYAGNGTTVVMPAWLRAYGGPLRHDEVEALTAFVLNWRPTALGEVQLAEPILPPSSDAKDGATLERGRQVFAAACAGCHALGSHRGDPAKGPDLTGIDQAAGTRMAGVAAEEYLRESFLVPGAHIAPGYEQTAPDKRCQGLLSETQLAEVIAFLLHGPQD